MAILGRPKVLNKTQITEICCLKYWNEGINNLSFNDIIKHSGVSKGSIYKMFGSEDNLKRETIKYYSDNIMQNHIKLFLECGNVNKVIYIIMDNSKKNNFKPCYFNISRSLKYTLGPKSKKQILNLEKITLAAWRSLISKHIKKNTIKRKINIKDLSLFIYNMISVLDILKFNKASKDELSSLFVILKHVVKTDLSYDHIKAKKYL